MSNPSSRRPGHRRRRRDTRDDFDADRLGPEWRYVRLPDEGVARLDVRPGQLALSLTPATLGDPASAAFVGRPQDDWAFTAATVLDVDLAGEHEAAGLALRQNDEFSLQLLVSRAADGSRTARAITRRDGTDRVDGAVPVGDGPVELTVEGRDLAYRLLANGHEVAVLDGRVLSTDVAGGFTGVMLGPYATSNGRPSTTPPTSTGSTTSAADSALDGAGQAADDPTLHEHEEAECGNHRDRREGKDHRGVLRCGRTGTARCPSGSVYFEGSSKTSKGSR